MAERILKATDKVIITSRRDSNTTTDASKTSQPLVNGKLSDVRDFDDILGAVGQFGRYQMMLLLFMFLPISFFIAVTQNLFLFQMVVPDHWCHVPGRENTSLSAEEWRNLTRSRSIETGEALSCLANEVQWTLHNGTISYIVTNQTIGCSDGWEFDSSQFLTTVATSMEWVCEHGHYAHYTLSISMAGNAVGTFLLPLLADEYLGRRRMFFVSLVLHILFTVPLLFVTGTAWHMVFRFLQGLAFETNYLMPYTIYLELVSPERRALVVTLSFMFWTFGMCATALVAWLIPSWKILALLSLIPPSLGFLYWRSPLVMGMWM